MQSWGITVLRLVVGLVFMAHGLPKLIPIWGTGPAQAAELFTRIGFEPALVLVLAVGAIELLAGAAVFFGVFTRLMAVPLVIDMAIAIWKVHLPNGFFLNASLEPGAGPGYEFNMVLIGGLLCLILAGPGALSVDGYRARNAESEAAGRARLRASKM